MPEMMLRDAFAEATPASRLSRWERLPAVTGYALSIILVGVATLVSAAAFRLTATSDLTLIFVLPVIVSASAFGWGPALLAVALGSIAYDYFFTEPYYSLTMTNPSEIWAVILLLIIASLSASVAAMARRRAITAAQAAERAEALQAVAHAVVHAEQERDVLDAAAKALHRLFHAPTVIYIRRNGAVTLAASAGGKNNSDADREAAEGALSTRVNTRGETYPYDRTYYDFWPVSSRSGVDCVLGVDFSRSVHERPTGAEQLIEAVGAYLSAALHPRRPQE